LRDANKCGTRNLYCRGNDVTSHENGDDELGGQGRRAAGGRGEGDEGGEEGVDCGGEEDGGGDDEEVLEDEVEHVVGRDFYAC